MIVRREKVLTGKVIRVDVDGSREDRSMRRLGRMLDDRAGIVRPGACCFYVVLLLACWYHKVITRK